MSWSTALLSLSIAQVSSGVQAPGHQLAELRSDAELGLALETVAQGLTRPVHVAAPPGDSRLFVVEQLSGAIRVVDGAGNVLPTPFLDLNGQVFGSGENGLLSLAFHPDFASNGRCFVYYNDMAGDTTLAEYAVVPPTANTVRPGSEVVLLSMPQPAPQHNGGILAFGPLDGMLYLSTGDGGGGGDPLDQGQDLGTLLGKVLRLDVNGAAPYAIPSDNPFVGVAGAREEIWAYGVRNPWRGGFDPATGDLFIGDVGQNLLEEIDWLPAGMGGLNFGWRCSEGTACTGAAGCTCPSPTFVDPIHEYDHSNGCSVIGGHVYRGAAIPGLGGTFFFADYCTGSVWSFVWNGQAKTEFKNRTSELLHPGGGGLGRISTFGVDGQGELLIASYTQGEVFRVIERPKKPDCDADGIADAKEIQNGTEFDVNTNGVPDACELPLTVTPLIEGQIARIQLLGATPGLDVRFYWTWRGVGSGPCVVGPICLDLIPFLYMGVPQVPELATVTADANGVAAYSWTYPVGQPYSKITFQAVILDGDDSKKSQPVLQLVQ